MNTFTKFAIGAIAAVLAGTQIAQAAPLMTMRLTSSGSTSGQCTAGAVLSDTVGFAGSTCTMTSGAGGMLFAGGYGGFNFDGATGIGNGTGGLSQPQPALWLDNNSSSNTIGATMVVELGVSGYDSPVSPFPLLATLSGTNGQGMRQTVTAFFDDADTGVIGAGTLLLSETFENFGSISGEFDAPAVYTGTYGLSWILTIERIGSVAGGINASTGFNGTFAQKLPGPAGLGLLGLGLLATGVIRRRKIA